MTCFAPVTVGGLRGTPGDNFTDVARRTGAYDATPADSDAAVLEKFAGAVVENNPGFSGARGPNGYSTVTLAQLRAAPFSDGPLMYAGRVWTGVTGNFSAVGADDRNIVKQNQTDLSAGAWVASYAVPTLTARTDGAGDSTPLVTSSIADAVARGSRGIYKPPGTTYITGRLADKNKRGLRVYGDGILIEDAEQSNLDTRRVIATYADDLDYVVGREHLTTAINVMAAGGVTLKASMFGDSTTGDFAITLPDYVPHRLLMRAARGAGFTSVDIKNNFVNGSVASMMDVNLIRPEDHIVFINYGVNDMGEIGDAVTMYYDRLDAKLSAIRAQYPYPQDTQTSGVTKDIVLLGPNSCNSWADGRAQFRYEQVRPLLIGLARKHKCCFVDKYAFMQDSTNAKPWMDENAVYNGPNGTLSQSNVHIHPTVLGNDKLWSLVARAVFGEFVGPNRANAFHNLDSVEATLVTAAPSSFMRGQTWSRMTGTGWPFDTGYVATNVQADGIISQTAYRFEPNGTSPPRVAVRVNVGPGNWGSWSNAWANLTLQGSWTVAGLARARVDIDGTLSLQGIISGGTKADGTPLFTLPAGYRPPINDIIDLAGDAGTVRVLYVASTGAVSLLGPTTSSMVYLSGFRGAVS